MRATRNGLWRPAVTIVLFTCDRWLPGRRRRNPSSATNIQSFDVYTVKAMKEWKVGAAWRNRLLGKSMVIFSIDGAANVSSMKVDNLDKFSRASAKSDTTSGVR